MDKVDGLDINSKKVKDFLINKTKECENIIRKRKRTNKRIKILYSGFITISIVGSSVAILLSSLAAPPLAVAIISGLTTVTSALSIKFN